MEKILRLRGRRLLLYAAEDRALPPSGSPGTLIRGGRLAQAARGAPFSRFRRSWYLAERRREVKSVRVRGGLRLASAKLSQLVTEDVFLYSPHRPPLGAVPSAQRGAPSLQRLGPRGANCPRGRSGGRLRFSEIDGVPTFANEQPRLPNACPSGLKADAAECPGGPETFFW